MPRAFWLAAGATAGVLAFRKAQAMARAATPSGLAERGAATASVAARQALGFWSTVRSAMAEREADLRQAMVLDGAGESDLAVGAAPRRRRRAG